MTEPGLARLSDAELAAYCGHVGELPAGLCLRTPVVRSASTGAEVDGLIIALAAARRGDAAPRAPRDGARRSAAPSISRCGWAPTWWAWAGSPTPLSDRGAAVTGRGVPITTGNALTAAAAFKAARRGGGGARPARSPTRAIAVLGARGSVGALMARLAARERPRAARADRKPAGRSGAARGAGPRSSAPPVRRAPTDADAASPAAISCCPPPARRAPSSTRCRSAPGTIVCDVARPPDAGPAVRGRADSPSSTAASSPCPIATLTFGPGNLQGLPPGSRSPACRRRSSTRWRGRASTSAWATRSRSTQADRALALCRRHGFRVAARGAGRFDRAARARAARDGGSAR